MLKANTILGMNARNQLYTTLNSKKARSICSSKYATKILLTNKNIPTAQIYAVMATSEDINEFDWSTLTTNFVIKPTNGNAGKGVIAFRKYSEKGHYWLDTLRRKWTLDDLKLHCFDILEGQYSTYGSNHKIIIEERVPIHPKLLKYSSQGTPDIRIIVFNSVPVMAMMRLPTLESEGRANLSQGAIGLGIDLATGLTTHAIIHKNQVIKYLPGTEKKLIGIKIPFWQKLLLTAVQASHAADLSFAGIDLFVHKEKGPMVVELNSNPGLSIQNANDAGLRRRLQRVEDLNVLNAEHGVRIGQALFAEHYADQIVAEEGIKIIQAKEEISLFDSQNHPHKVNALINTGRQQSVVAFDLMEDLNLIEIDDPLWFNTSREEGKIPIVEIKIKLKQRTIKTTAIVSKRLNRKKCKIEIGRHDLAGFLIKAL